MSTSQQKKEVKEKLGEEGGEENCVPSSDAQKCLIGALLFYDSGKIYRNVKTKYGFSLDRGKPYLMRSLSYMKPSKGSQRDSSESGGGNGNRGGAKVGKVNGDATSAKTGVSDNRAPLKELLLTFGNRKRGHSQSAGCVDKEYASHVLRNGRINILEAVINKFEFGVCSIMAYIWKKKENASEMKKLTSFPMELITNNFDKDGLQFTFDTKMSLSDGFDTPESVSIADEIVFVVECSFISERGFRDYDGHRLRSLKSFCGASNGSEEGRNKEKTLKLIGAYRIELDSDLLEFSVKLIKDGRSSDSDSLNDTHLIEYLIRACENCRKVPFLKARLIDIDNEKEHQNFILLKKAAHRGAMRKRNIVDDCRFSMPAKADSSKQVPKVQSAREAFQLLGQSRLKYELSLSFPPYICYRFVLQKDGGQEQSAISKLLTNVDFMHNVFTDRTANLGTLFGENIDGGSSLTEFTRLRAQKFIDYICEISNASAEEKEYRKRRLVAPEWDGSGRLVQYWSPSEKCFFCLRTFPNIFSLLLHLSTSYPLFNIVFKGDIRDARQVANSAAPLYLDVYLTKYALEFRSSRTAIENRSVSAYRKRKNTPSRLTPSDLLLGIASRVASGLASKQFCHMRLFFSTVDWKKRVRSIATPLRVDFPSGSMVPVNPNGRKRKPNTDWICELIEERLEESLPEVDAAFAILWNTFLLHYGHLRWRMRRMVVLCKQFVDMHREKLRTAPMRSAYTHHLLALFDAESLDANMVYQLIVYLDGPPQDPLSSGMLSSGSSSAVSKKSKKQKA